MDRCHSVEHCGQLSQCPHFGQLSVTVSQCVALQAGFRGVCHCGKGHTEYGNTDMSQNVTHKHRCHSMRYMLVSQCGGT